jgi:arylsulfatase A-like enzyme
MPGAVTLPRLFKTHGYRVVGCGKIYHGRFPDPTAWHDFYYKPADPVPEKRLANPNAMSVQFDWGPINVADREMGDYRVASWAIRQLKKRQDTPFFLACGIFRPHLPWHVPQKYFEQFPVHKLALPTILDNDLNDVPPFGRKLAVGRAKVKDLHNHRGALQGYLASIAFADAQVGRLLDALDESVFAENTIIVLWSDHGQHLGEKNHWGKFALWEEAVRAPLLFVVPGMTKNGSKCERVVSLLDVYPTLADLCGLPVGKELHGVSLRPLLENPTIKWDRPAITTHGRNNHSVRTERWRYTRYEDGSEELYDHNSDPQEWKNLASCDQYEVVKIQLAHWFPRENVPLAIRPRLQVEGRVSNVPGTWWIVTLKAIGVSLIGYVIYKCLVAVRLKRDHEGRTAKDVD